MFISKEAAREQYDAKLCNRLTLVGIVNRRAQRRENRRRELKLQRKREEMEKRHAKRKALFQDKLDLVLTMRKQGKTLREIADIFDVTHQRIQQLSTLIPDFPKRQVKPKLTKFCQTCKKEFVAATEKSKFCSRKCTFESRKVYKTRKELLAHNAKRARAYYHRVIKNLPDFHERIRKYNQNYKKNNPESYWRAVRKSYKKQKIKFNLRYRTDPLFREKMKANYREYYRRKMV